MHFYFYGHLVHVKFPFLKSSMEVKVLVQNAMKKVQYFNFSKQLVIAILNNMLQRFSDDL